jgi:hypothetical protein
MMLARVAPLAKTIEQSIASRRRDMVAAIAPGMSCFRSETEFRSWRICPAGALEEGRPEGRPNASASPP